MRTAKLLKVAALCAIGLLAGGPAMAEKCSGRFTNVGQSAETLDLGKGHTLTIFYARGSATSDNSPHTGVGGCGGYVLTTPDGKSKLAYACARKNKDGDSWSDAGTLEPGATRGSWTQTGGTGVFAGKSDSGWWQPIVDDGKVTSGIWEGNCQ